jgi:hypothetical protein
MSLEDLMKALSQGWPYLLIFFALFRSWPLSWVE